MINIGLLKNFSRVKKHNKGAAFAAGEMYIILKGDVGLYTNYRKKSEEMIAKMGPGDFFGEAAFLMEARVITAAALTDVFALSVNEGTMTLLAKAEPDIVSELMKAMYGRLDRLSAAYRAACGCPWAEAEHAPQEEAQPKDAPPEQLSVEKDNKETIPATPEAAGVYEQSGEFSLFPEGHGNYELPLSSQDKACLMVKNYSCPLCGKEFEGRKVKNSKLMLECTDNDMRNHYKGIEPLYYEVLTCPRCLYSATEDMFNKSDKPRPELPEQLRALSSKVSIRTGADRDTFSVFASYYLALLCAPRCFISNTLIAAKLYLKLSWLYQDCGDKGMADEYTGKALQAYIDIYEKGDITGNMEQQLCLIIGELSYKRNDMKNAIDFLFKAKNSLGGVPYIKTKAEDRIFEIRGVE